MAADLIRGHQNVQSRVEAVEGEDSPVWANPGLPRHCGFQESRGFSSGIQYSSPHHTITKSFLLALDDRNLDET